MKLLLIEDSERLLRSLGAGFRKAGHSVDLCSNGKDGLDYASYNSYDVIVLDLMLPGMDGLSVLKHLRELGKDTHILILSAKDQVEDRIRGLKHGADDYMVKPFDFDELCARIEALSRRKYGSKNPDLKLGGIVLKTHAREVWKNDQPVDLTPSEYSVLECLVLNRGRVLSKEQIVNAIHDSESEIGTNLVEVMICNLRKKLSQPGEASVIRTRRGFGYYVDGDGTT